MADNTVITPLTTQVGSLATRNSADIYFSGRGVLLHVKFANLAGAATFTPQLQWKDASGNYNTIWTAAAAIAANSDKTYAICPGNVDAGAHTEAKQIALPRTFRVNLVYSGNGTTDKADTTLDMDILI